MALFCQWDIFEIYDLSSLMKKLSKEFHLNQTNLGYAQQLLETMSSLSDTDESYRVVRKYDGLTNINDKDTFEVVKIGVFTI